MGDKSHDLADSAHCDSCVDAVIAAVRPISVAARTQLAWRRFCRRTRCSGSVWIAFLRIRRHRGASSFARRSLPPDRRRTVALFGKRTASVSLNQSPFLKSLWLNPCHGNRHADRFRSRCLPGRDRRRHDDDLYFGGGVTFAFDSCCYRRRTLRRRILSAVRRRLAQLIIGLGLLSNGTNLLIFTAGGLTRARAPIVPEGAQALTNLCRSGPAIACFDGDRYRIWSTRLFTCTRTSCSHEHGLR